MQRLLACHRRGFPVTAEDRGGAEQRDGIEGIRDCIEGIRAWRYLTSHGRAKARSLVRDSLIFGNVRTTFAKFIRNGEPVVSVRAVTDEEAELPLKTCANSPIVIELVPL
jgi:hypothetical protein